MKTNTTEPLSRVQDCPLGMPGGHLGALGRGNGAPVYKGWSERLSRGEVSEMRAEIDEESST